MLSEEERQNLIMTFCQHCQALQKECGLKVKPCWLLQGIGEAESPPICASATDAVNHIINKVEARTHREVLEDIIANSKPACLGWHIIPIGYMENQLREARAKEG